MPSSNNWNTRTSFPVIIIYTLKKGKTEERNGLPSTPYFNTDQRRN